jgi:hypothetical protein
VIRLYYEVSLKFMTTDTMEGEKESVRSTQAVNCAYVLLASNHA